MRPPSPETPFVCASTADGYTLGRWLPCRQNGRSSGQPPSDRPPSEQDERFGPLALARTRKDDGRALILYAHDERDRERERPIEDRPALQRAARRAGRLRDPPPGAHVPAHTRALSAGPHPTRRAADGDPATPHFEIAVFDNRFPAFEQPQGAAEVVVYTDEHDGSLGHALAAASRGADVGLAPPLRRSWAPVRTCDYVMIFENRGVEVGVTLHHPHGQIYGYPFLPPVPALELAADERLGGCAPCAAACNASSPTRSACFSRTRRRRLRPPCGPLGL